MNKYIHTLKELCLEITGVCPLNCMHCSGSCGLDTPNTMSLPQILKIVEDFSKMGGELLEISGGEPLIHPDLEQVVGYAKKNDIEPILYTSGNMLDKDGRITPLNTNLAQKLRGNLQKVIFNLQGACQSTHEAITRVRGSFRNTITSIKTAKSLGYWVGVHFVPMKLNYMELEGLLLLCHDLKVDEVGILRFVPQGRGEVNRTLLELSLEEFKKLNKKLTEVSFKHQNPKLRVGRPVDFRFLFNRSVVKAPCDAGISRCLITPEGNVTPCPAFKRNRQFIAGNIMKSSLLKIWTESPIWRKFRFFRDDKVSDPCKSCEHFLLCKGGCVAQRTLAYSNDVYATPDPRCFKRLIEVEAICPSCARDRGEL